MKAWFLILFCSWFATISQAQDQHLIKILGSIQDKKTREPIPFASIVLTESNFGSASDESGQFTFIYDKAVHPASKLKISSIGYKSRLYSIDSLISKSNGSPINFLLEQDAILLDQVEISSQGLSGRMIVESAIAAIPSNTYDKPFILEYYSKVKVSDSLNNVYTEENVFQDFNQGGYHSAFYLQQRHEGISPFEKRKCGITAHFDILMIDVLGSSYRNGIVDKKVLAQFDIKYEGVIAYEGDSVYVLSYNAPKPTKQITTMSSIPKNYSYSGKLYIEIQSNAIVRHSLLQGTPKSKLSQEILYRKIDGFFFPYYIKSERLIEIEKKKGMRMSNVLMLRDATLDAKRPNPRYDNCNPPKFDKEFWSKFL